MIKEAKNFASNLVAALTPATLANDTVTGIDVNGSYDWNTQSYSYDVCKFGTNAMTSSQTCSGQFNFTDDNPTDNVMD